MSIITVISRNPDRHNDLMGQLKRIEIGHIQKELQARAYENFAAQFGEAGKLSTTFNQKASGKAPQIISLKDAALHYDMEQLNIPPRRIDCYDRNFGIVYQQTVACRMSAYEAMERFNCKDKQTFLWLGRERNAALFSDLRLAAAHVGNINVSHMRDTLFENHNL